MLRISFLWIFCSEIKGLPVKDTPSSLPLLSSRGKVSQNDPSGTSEIVRTCHGYPCMYYKELRDKISQLEHVISGTMNTIQRESLESLAIDKDILLTTEQVDRLIQQTMNLRSDPRRKKRQIDAAMPQLWNFPIPYKIGVQFNATTADNVRAAVRHWESETCITFREIRSESDVPEYPVNYVEFVLY
jgi:hypothetical protein